MGENTPAQCDSLRCFVALFPAKETRSLLLQKIESVGWDEDQINWTQPNNIHLTLDFLGAVDSSEIESLVARLTTQLQSIPPLTISLKRFSLLPRQNKPRHFVCGIRPNFSLMCLHQSVALATKRYSQPQPDRAYFPHVTLGRMAKGGAVHCPPWSGPEILWPVDGCALMKSVITEKEAFYETVSSFDLLGR